MPQIRSVMSSRSFNFSLKDDPGCINEALFHAAANENLELARLFLDKGASCSAEIRCGKNNLSMPAIAYVAAYCSPEMMDLFVQHGGIAAIHTALAQLGEESLLRFGYKLPSLYRIQDSQWSSEDSKTTAKAKLQPILAEYTHLVKSLMIYAQGLDLEEYSEKNALIT